MTEGEPPKYQSSLKPVSAWAHEQDMEVVPTQEAVTNTRLLPAMPRILAHLRMHRDSVDRDFEAARRSRGTSNNGMLCGLPVAEYPVGFCCHIRNLVWVRACADPAFRALIGHDVLLRHVFILLKGQYFQNAVQLGNLYVDVANDTVWVDKPKLEWSPVSTVAYENLESWTRFGDVAQRYLKVRLYPNFLFPFAFPVSPFFAIKPSGQLDLLFAQDALFLKDLGEDMPRIQALLADKELMSRRLPRVYEELLRQACGGSSPAAFPLKFQPAGSEELRHGIVADFIRLGREPWKRAHATVDRYMHLMRDATQRITQLRLIPNPTELDRLRAVGAVPGSVVIHRDKSRLAMPVDRPPQDTHLHATPPLR